MGLLDSIRDRASSAVTQVKQGVSDAVHTVEARAAAVVQKVEQKAVDTGHAVQSAFESKAPIKPPPSAPPPTSSARAVTSGPAGLRASLDKAILDQLKPPPTSSEAQAQAKALKESCSSWKGLDEEKLAKEMAALAKKDPVAAAPILKELMNTQLDRSDRDDVAQAFTHELSGDQLNALARHPDGAAALATMEHELRTGYTTKDEAAMADRIKDAIGEGSTGKLPNTPVEITPGALGEFTPTVPTDSKKTPTGKIPPEMWADPSKLAAALTQNPATGTTPGNTCAASSVLASTLMASPEKAARFLENVGKSEDAKNLTVRDRNELLGIADRIRNKTASFEDLNKAQGLLFTAGNTHGDSNTILKALQLRGGHLGADGETFVFNNLNAADSVQLKALLAKETPWTDQEVGQLQALTNRATGLSMRMEKVDGSWAPKIEGDLATMDPAGFSDAETRKLAKMGGLKPETAVPDGPMKPSDVAARLKPGEAVSLRVSGDGTNKASDHFVTLGRRDDGTLYLYNSDPASKDASLTVGGKGAGTPAFQAVLAGYDKRQVKDPNNTMPSNIPYRLD